MKNAEEKFIRLIADIAGRNYLYTAKGQEKQVCITLSCGVAEFSSGDSAEDVIQRADDALYHAKTKRNHVSVCRKPLLGGFFKD